MRDAAKTEHIKILSRSKSLKNNNFTTITLKFGLVKWSVSISFVYRHQSGPRHPSPAQQVLATNSGNQQFRHVTHIRDQILEHNSMPYRDGTRTRSLRFLANPCTLLYRVFCRHQEQDAASQVSMSKNRSLRTWLPKRLPKTEASENRSHKLFDVYNTHKKIYGLIEQL